jgi:Flp pilus assembly protein TadD
MSTLSNKLPYLVIVCLLSACAGNIQPDSREAGSSLSPASDGTSIEFSKAIDAMANNDNKLAESILTKLTTSHPALAGPWNNLGIIQYRENNYDAAMTSAQQAIKINPASAEAFNLLAMSEVQLGHINKARQHYTTAIDLKPDYANAQYNIALLYDIYYQDIDNAILHYIKYLELVKSDDKATRDWLDQLVRQRKKQGKT